MRQRLILHIGTHKTGSTALQHFLGLNRGRLARQGVCFPRPLGGHVRHVHRDLRDAGVAAGPQSPEFTALLERYVATIRAQGAPIAVLSCEGWWIERVDFAAAFAPLAARFDVTVVAYVRRADFYLESIYRQTIQNQDRPRALFTGFANKQMRRVMTRRAAILDRWAAVFGVDRVHAIPYEPARPGFDVVDRFGAVTGLGPAFAGCRPVHRWRANPSLSRVQTEFVRRALIDGLSLSRWQMHGLRYFGRGPGHYLGQRSRARLVARSAEDMDRIARTYVRDGRDTLFPTPPEREPADAQDWVQTLDPAFEARLRLWLRLPPVQRAEAPMPPLDQPGQTRP